MIGETPARLTVHKLACGTCATERSRQQRNGPEADFGGARELPCNKQGVSQLSPLGRKLILRHGMAIPVANRPTRNESRTGTLSLDCVRGGAIGATRIQLWERPGNHQCDVILLFATAAELLDRPNN